MEWCLDADSVAKALGPSAGAQSNLKATPDTRAGWSGVWVLILLLEHLATTCNPALSI